MNDSRSRSLAPVRVALRVVALLGVCFPSFLVASETLADPGDPTLIPRQRLEALIEHMRIAANERETMSASFVQTKESSLFVDKTVAEGTFSYEAPDRVRWEYLQPEPMTLLIHDGVALTWYRDLERAERYNVGKQSQRVLEYLGASSSIKELLEYFRISLEAHPEEGEPYWLRLTPRYSRIAKHLQELELWIDETTFVPVRLRFVEPDGDVTDYQFTDVRVNEEIPGARFEIDLPAGLDVRDVDLPRRTGTP